MIAESSVLGWVIGIFICLLLLAWVIKQATLLTATVQNKRKCRFCGSRLKVAQTGGMSPVCPRCGRVQPWAQTHESPPP